MNRQSLILVVEQNLHNLQLLKSHLETLNFSCICAKQGIKALMLAQAHKPDLILLDTMLPDLICIEVINRLKQNLETANIPIVAMTVLTSLQHSDLIFLTGADDCITKPCDLNELDVVLNRYLTYQQSSA
jgi:two-component system, cell cycle response regulator DivK